MSERLSRTDVIKKADNIADLSLEGFARVGKLLALLAYLAVVSENKHIETVATEALNVISEYKDHLDDYAEELAALKAEVNHV